MLFPGCKRSGLALVIVVLHVWVFLSGRISVELPPAGPRQYIEVWNVVPPRLDKRLAAENIAKPMSPKRETSRGAEHTATAHARPIHRTIDQIDTPPDIPGATTAPLVASEPNDPFDATRPRPQKENAHSPIDVDRLRSLARDDEKNRIKTPLEKLHEREHIVRSIETKVADGAARAARKDCQTAYGGAGVFAIVPLLYGTLTDDGCKWK